jgi:hypothetical protein
MSRLLRVLFVALVASAVAAFVMLLTPRVAARRAQLDAATDDDGLTDEERQMLIAELRSML